jgi:uncharacterized protein YfaS (alpha-2-macroglobulin family)
MSRFLPAVIVRAASQEVALDLPPEIYAMLPEVITRGLARLYNFQHADGGWGWWEKDASDDRMSIYVLEGLARCRLAGVDVNAETIARGAGFVRGRLGHLAEPLRARAHLALALAGEIDSNALAAYATDLKSVPDARAYTALACRAAGLQQLGVRLHNSLSSWKPESSSDLALRLATQLAFADDLKSSSATADALLARRAGHQWENTHTTSLAIQSLAQLLAYQTNDTPAKSISAKVAGKTILDCRDTAQLKRLSFSSRLTTADIPQLNTLPIMLAADAPQSIHYAISATGIQRLENAQPSGNEIRLHRAYQTLTGQPIKQPLKPGDVIACRLTLDLKSAYEYLIIEERRPSLCEYADERLDGPLAGDAANVEFRDDRVAVFFTRLPAGRHELVYYLRAETRGQSSVLPGVAYPMYEDQIRGETGTSIITVR